MPCVSLISAGAIPSGIRYSLNIEFIKGHNIGSKNLPALLAVWCQRVGIMTIYFIVTAWKRQDNNIEKCLGTQTYKRSEG
jgi:hypothetical protein